MIPKKGAEDPPQLNMAEMVFRGDRTAGNGDVDAVQKRDGTEKKEPENKVPAHIAASLLRLGGTTAESLDRPRSS